MITRYLDPWGFSLFCSPRFLIKFPNTKRGALLIPRLLGILRAQRASQKNPNGLNTGKTFLVSAGF